MAAEQVEESGRQTIMASRREKTAPFKDKYYYIMSA
jgi:hypothetical protein